MSNEIIQIDAIEHIKSRSMWAGCKDMSQHNMFVMEENDSSDIGFSFNMKEVEYPPVLYKMIDEIIVNSIDHHTIYPNKVTNIAVELKDNGLISVYNNGPGIKIKKRKNTKGEEMYTPQMAFSEAFAGSNLNDEENSERIVGGQNGLGATITNAHSLYFKVETNDGRFNYEQVFENELEIKNKPEIRKSKRYF